MPEDLAEIRICSQSLVSMAAYPNCTKRQGGLPCDDAIATGGQLVRITRVRLRGPEFAPCLVWCSQSYGEGEYQNVCSTPLFGRVHFY